MQLSIELLLPAAAASFSSKAASSSVKWIEKSQEKNDLSTNCQDIGPFVLQ
jgi:hypothetical protein